ncbi:sulfotransferase family protein [Aestuariibacter salexigens]|uniref:sulfotransferase family protein n=1 Tax=Aestuariibacter salexigens TaxID=226010 RepID=UPI000407EE2D|nr:sulfotransferase family protein [Aestuariibacter salexigens]
MKVFGAGLGRTGTMSMRVALNDLGFGPCHHMKAVIEDMPQQLPAWNDVVAGKPDWAEAYKGQQSAVDWPTASFYEPLSQAFPDAKFILTHRDPNNWADSISETILTALAGVNDAPSPVKEWMQMCLNVLALAGVKPGMSHADLTDAFHTHNERVKTVIPSHRLLVFQVKEGWAPLCNFLGVSAPDTNFPRTNDREEFFRHVSEAGQ